jgi:hypothetical protein
LTIWPQALWNAPARVAVPFCEGHLHALPMFHVMNAALARQATR